MDRDKNKSFSGIEFRDKQGKLINFIRIKHDEILEKSKESPHRIIVKLDDNLKPILPPPLTFEEIIQAKRRQQNILYGNVASNSTNAILSTRSIAARRVAAARRSVKAAAASNIGRRRRQQQQQQRRPISSLTRRKPTSSKIDNSQVTINSQVNDPQVNNVEPIPSTSNSIFNENILNHGHMDINASGAKEKKKSTKKKLPKVPKPNKLISDAPLPPLLPVEQQKVAKTPEKHEAKSQKISPYSGFVKEPENKSEPIPGSSGIVVTSMKDLARKGDLLDIDIDTKELKLLLKSAPPGASVVLPDGTVIKKSRRGGARAGAGRKRSRPITGQLQQQLSAYMTESETNPSELTSEQNSDNQLETTTQA